MLTTTSSAKGVDLKGGNLRVIVKGDAVEIRHATGKAAGRPCGAAEIGVDRGYTEALKDSDGTHHGEKCGVVLMAFGDAHLKTGKARNRLQAPEKKHRAAGHLARAEHIMTHNLGRAKLEARRDRTQKKRRIPRLRSRTSSQAPPIRRKWTRSRACWKAIAWATGFAVQTGAFTRQTSMLRRTCGTGFTTKRHPVHATPSGDADPARALIRRNWASGGFSWAAKPASTKCG